MVNKISYISTIFISYAILTMTIYSIYIGFGPQSKKLRDPFQEHEE
ncbi:MAG: photosystem II protein N [Gammaproteobacteria bacterium]